MLLASKFLNLIGAILLALPAAHVLLASRGFDALVKKAQDKGQLEWLAEATRTSFLNRLNLANATLFLIATVAGLLAIIAGFSLDFLCATRWIGSCLPTAG